MKEHDDWISEMDRVSARRQLMLEAFEAFWWLAMAMHFQGIGKLVRWSDDYTLKFVDTFIQASNKGPLTHYDKDGLPVIPPSENSDFDATILTELGRRFRRKRKDPS